MVTTNSPTMPDRPGSASVRGLETSLVARACELAHSLVHGSGAVADPVALEKLEHAAGCAQILAEIDADQGAIAAAWLYGMPAQLPLSRIEREFGADIARVVDGMRRLRRLREIHAEHEAARSTRAAAVQLETLRRMLLALSVDARVVLLRLASRLQTLRSHARARTVPPEALCREALDVFAPLANRLGIWALKWQLEDLAFRFLEPERYHELARAVDRKRTDRERLISQAIVTLSNALSQAGIRGEVLGRPKHLYGLASKMDKKNLTLAQVHDLHALRVIVDDIPMCYQALDVVHALWPLIPEDFDDYISAPKGNGYRSLHTVVDHDDGAPLEVQVRTREMHEAAEYGDASHWRYKEGFATVAKDGFSTRIAWLRQLLAWQRDIGQSIGGATLDGAPDPTVYTMTPQGRVIALPAGATAIDFAYALHTDVGHRCRGARIDGTQVPLTRRLETGDTVEIVLARGQRQAAAGPSRDWLNPALGYLASQRARTKVRHWFAVHEAGNGGGVMAPAAAAPSVGTTLSGEGPTVEVRDPLRRRAPRRRSPTTPGVLIEGVDALLTQLARCCRPLPPDRIGGYVTRGSGVTIHRQSCHVWQQLMASSPERIVAAAWPGVVAGVGARASATTASSSDSSPRYAVDLEIFGAAGEGLLSEVAEVLAREKVPLVAASRNDRGESGLLRLTIELDTADALTGLLRQISKAPGVRRASRR